MYSSTQLSVWFGALAMAHPSHSDSYERTVISNHWAFITVVVLLVVAFALFPGFRVARRDPPPPDTDEKVIVLDNDPEVLP